MFVCPVSLDPSKHQHHMLMGLPHDRLDQDVQKKRALKIGRGRGGGGMRSIREVTKANSVISALWYPGVTLPDRVPCLVLGRKTVACSSRQYTDSPLRLTNGCACLLLDPRVNHGLLLSTCCGELFSSPRRHALCSSCVRMQCGLSDERKENRGAQVRLDGRC